MLKLSEKEAKERYPKLVAASLGGQRKDKKNGTYTARVLFDGTNGISVSKRTRVRDQKRSPIAADINRERAKMSERTFALTADVAEAHRQVPIDPVDWHCFGAQIRPGDVNTVGTFSISSASYYWSRVGSSLGRLSHYISAHAAHTWHLPVADDFHLEAGGAGYPTSYFLSRRIGKEGRMVGDTCFCRLCQYGLLVEDFSPDLEIK